MNKLKRQYELTISLLAPLHIGTGRELLLGYDYVVFQDKTWFLDPAILLDAFVDAEGNFDERILARPASELLEPQDYRIDNPIFRYVIPGRPRSDRAGAIAREQIKDVYGRPYLPGSSIKGALRTILAWHGYKTLPDAKLDVNSIRGNAKWAGQEIERTVFGRNPNYDLLRMLQVADSEPIDADRLRLVNAQVVTGSDRLGSPIEVETILTDSIFHTKVTIDQFLASPDAEQRLRLGQRATWLDELPMLAQAWGQEYLTAERAWFAKRNYIRIEQLYTQMLGLLAGKKLGSNRFFLQIGWGGGWGSKTIGEPLRQDAREWERLLSDRRLSPARIRRRSGDAFPKSRRVLVLSNQPVAPFGWCLAEMKEVS